MKLEQLRSLSKIVEHGYSVSRAAEAMNTPQPGLSRQIRALERELGVDLFRRSRKRLLGLTAPGGAILEVARRMLEDADNLGKIAREHAGAESGSLTVATTHTQSRYALPDAIQRFSARYPGVRLMLRQGNPADITAWVRGCEADLCIGSQSAPESTGLVLLPCRDLRRIVLTPPGHPLLRERRITLESLARYPIITYDPPFVGRSRLLQAFEARGLAPNIVLSATDTDVIKAYAERGLGVAIVAEPAFDRTRDRKLRAIRADHLFESNTIYVGIRRNDYLRGYLFDFIEMYAPQYKRHVIEKALAAARA